MDSISTAIHLLLPLMDFAISKPMSTEGLTTGTPGADRVMGNLHLNCTFTGAVSVKPFPGNLQCQWVYRLSHYRPVLFNLFV